MTPEPAPEPSKAIWPALTAGADGHVSRPDLGGPGWIPLRQHWRGLAGPEARFHPGWARLWRAPSALSFEVVLKESGPRNRARRMNERTWELGSICEFFVQAIPDRYIELHVTPENHRLQLDWPLDGLQAFRSGAKRFEDFLVAREDWCRSAVLIDKDAWTVRLDLPFASLGLPNGPTGPLRAAVCRYDCSVEGEPILSSTAFLTFPSYHRREEWHRVEFLPAGSPPPS